ncbi:MAG: GNAT family N-acetyltransferase [Desulfobacterales bacterium]
MKNNRHYTVSEETIDALSSYWCNPDHPLEWTCLFTSPLWMGAWWHVFGDGSDGKVWVVRDGHRVIGIAPLRLEGAVARFVGSPDVCDFLDFAVTRGKGVDFLGALIDHLGGLGVSHLDLGPFRSDSITVALFSDIAQDRGWQVQWESEDVAYELDLPATWEEYLQELPGKQRHEIRRKFRRLEGAGAVNFRIADDCLQNSDDMDLFLSLFRMNRADKSEFMTDTMMAFFRSLATSLAGSGMLKLFFLELDAVPAAAIMCFDYGSTMYLYNNGYDSRFSSLSVGMLSKMLSIKNSIETGKKTYDFLKGNETYKKQLGGKAVQLYRCLADLR